MAAGKVEGPAPLLTFGIELNTRTLSFRVPLYRWSSSVTYSAASRTQNIYETPVSYNRWLGIRITCIRPCPEGGPCEQPLPFGQYQRQLGQTRCLSTAARTYRPRMGLDCAQGLVWFAHTPASSFCCRDLLAICSWTHLIVAVVPSPYHTWLWYAWPSENPLHSMHSRSASPLYSRGWYVDTSGPERVLYYSDNVVAVQVLRVGHFAAQGQAHGSTPLALLGAHRDTNFCIWAVHVAEQWPFWTVALQPYLFQCRSLRVADQPYPQHSWTVPHWRQLGTSFRKRA